MLGHSGVNRCFVRLFSVCQGPVQHQQPEDGGQERAREDPDLAGKKAKSGDEKTCQTSRFKKEARREEKSVGRTQEDHESKEVGITRNER